MRTVNECHNKAMESTELALKERARGNRKKSVAAFRRALDHELGAIEALDGIVEPTWSVLHRSAATLALECYQFRKAEQLVAKALAQEEPPPEIAGELRDLLEQILRHTDPRRGDNDVRLSTAQSRSVFFPRLEQIVRIVTFNISDAESDRFNDQKSAEKFLAESVQFIFGAPVEHFMSYSSWGDIGNRILNSLEGSKFKKQMTSSAAGEDKNRRDDITKKMASWTSAIHQSKERLPDEEAFAKCVIRNLIMNGMGVQNRSLGTFFDSSDYSTNRSLVQPLYGNLLQFDEKMLQLWAAVTHASFNTHIIPSTKTGFKELLVVQVPFSGSPEIVPVTLEEAVKCLRGVGVFHLPGISVLRGTAWLLVSR